MAIKKCDFKDPCGCDNQKTRIKVRNVAGGPARTVTDANYDNDTGTFTLVMSIGGNIVVSGFPTGGSDGVVTSGTYDNLTGELTLTRSIGADVVITGFPTSFANLYNANGSLTTNRVVDLDGNNITFQNGGDFIIDGKLTVTGIIDPTGLNLSGPQADAGMPNETIYITDGSASTFPSGTLVFKNGAGAYVNLEGGGGAAAFQGVIAHWGLQAILNGGNVPQPIPIDTITKIAGFTHDAVNDDFELAVGGTPGLYKLESRNHYQVDSGGVVEQWWEVDTGSGYSVIANSPNQSHTELNDDIPLRSVGYVELNVGDKVKPMFATFHSTFITVEPPSTIAVIVPPLVVPRSKIAIVLEGT